jgi:hypothetical protein
MFSMGAPESARRQAHEPSSPSSQPTPPRPSHRLPLGTSEAQRTVIGMGVPVAPSFLDLDEEQTVAYDARATPAFALNHLLAECGRASDTQRRRLVLADPVTPSEIRPREASFHTVPNFPNESNPEIVTSESNLHEIDGDQITDTLAPHEAVAEVVHLRIGLSSHPPPGVVAPAIPRPAPSRRRSLLAKFLFVVIGLTIALVAASELAAAGTIPRIDPRPLFTKTVKLAKEKIPWERLPKLPKI